MGLLRGQGGARSPARWRRPGVLGGRAGRRRLGRGRRWDPRRRRRPGRGRRRRAAARAAGAAGIATRRGEFSRARRISNCLGAAATPRTRDGAAPPRRRTDSERPPNPRAPHFPRARLSHAHAIAPPPWLRRWRSSTGRTAAAPGIGCGCAATQGLQRARVYARQQAAAAVAATAAG